MKGLRFALIAEGRTEEALLGHLEVMCLREGAQVVEGFWANELLALHDTGKTVAAQVQVLLRLDPSIDLVFIHRDSDARVDEPRRAEIAEGVAASGHSTVYVPIVPIQETEAWLLLDESAIRRVVANEHGTEDLGLPRPGQAERRAGPKRVLLEALRRASKPGRGRTIDNRAFGRLRRELLQNLDIDGDINQLAAWQNLLRDLQTALAELSSSPCPPSTHS